MSKKKDNGQFTPDLSYLETKMTFDYDQFSFVTENRDVTRNFLNQLKRSISRKDLGERYPILVDSSYRIYDGQNRFVARKELKLPIYFQIDDHLTIDDIGRVSANVKKWTPADWLKYHLAIGENLQYKVYQGFKKRFNLSHTIALTMLNHGEYTRSMFDSFKEGSLTIPNINEANRLAIRCVEMRDLVPFPLSKVWFVAMVNIITHPDYNHKRMITKLGKYSGRIRPVTKWQEAARELEGVFNWRSQAFVRFI